VSDSTLRGLAALAGFAGAVACGGGGEEPGGPAVGGTDCAPFVMPADCSVPAGAVLPGELRCTGLYGDFETRKLACGVEGYVPAYELWSDGAEKDRWVSMPPGATVDVSDPDGFVYPVGTRFWKEFRGPSRLLETRLLEKSAAGWIYTTYVWSTDETTAVQQNDGVPNLDGTGHTVPSRVECKACHSGRPDYVLGWDALMLGEGASGVTASTLLADERLTWAGKAEGSDSPLGLSVPGDDVERAALGYLHANCGVSCHNETAPALARETGLFTRLDADALGDAPSTPVVVTGVGRTPSPNATIADLVVPAAGPFVDLMPLDAERSLLLARMKVRESEAQMPRVATNRVDDAGVDVVERWILSMTLERGYSVP